MSDRPRARNTDPSTSHAAARSVRDVTANQDAVLKLMNHVGGQSTDEDLVAFYYRDERQLGLPEQSPSGIRTRRRELADKGLVHDSGEKVPITSGRNAIVWKVGPPPAVRAHAREVTSGMMAATGLVPLDSDDDLF